MPTSAKRQFQEIDMFIISHIRAVIARSIVARNTATIYIGIAAQLVMQVAYFALLTRTIGASQYGVLIGATILAGISGTFSGWGGEQILVRTVSRDRELFARALGNALIYFAICAPFVVLVATIAIPLVVGHKIPLYAVFLIVLSDACFVRVHTLAIHCFQAFERGREIALLSTVLPASKTVLILVWIAVVPVPTLSSLAWFYCGASVVAAAFAAFRVLMKLGYPNWQIDWRHMKDGGFFALQGTSFVAFNDLDKPFVLVLSDFHQSGVYAAASRIADVAAGPIRALIFSTYARFFRQGEHGPIASVRYAVRLAPVGIALGGLAGVALAIFSPFASAILGEHGGYNGVGAALVYLAPVPLLMALYYLGADALVSCGHVGLRTLI